MLNLNHADLIDLTHTLSAEIPSWNGDCGFRSNMANDYDACMTRTKFRTHSLEMQAGIGTHMDAPLHCFKGAKSIADIPLEQLVVACVVIDIPANVPSDYALLANDILRFEQEHGKIKKNAFVIVRTGWGKYWQTPNQYRNELVFPTISSAAAQILLERDIVGIGIDTLSPDNPKYDYPVHEMMLGAGKYIVENIANAECLPQKGSIIVVSPIKIKDGTEAPIRLFAIIPR